MTISLRLTHSTYREGYSGRHRVTVYVSISIRIIRVMTLSVLVYLQAYFIVMKSLFVILAVYQKFCYVICLNLDLLCFQSSLIRTLLHHGFYALCYNASYCVRANCASGKYGICILVLLSIG